MFCVLIMFSTFTYIVKQYKEIICYRQFSIEKEHFNRTKCYR